VAAIDDANSQRFYHGTKVDLKPGDLIEPGYNSNFGRRKKAAYVYLTATLDAAVQVQRNRGWTDGLWIRPCRAISARWSIIC
jgi:hypothetical protein